jgi:hypothetical protein
MLRLQPAGVLGVHPRNDVALVVFGDRQDPVEILDVLDGHVY